VTAARTLGGLQAIEDNWRRACAAALDVMPPDPALGAVARRGVGLLAVRQDDTSFWFRIIFSNRCAHEGTLKHEGTAR
jgi:hypothetical protein